MSVLIGVGGGVSGEGSGLVVALLLCVRTIPPIRCGDIKLFRLQTFSVRNDEVSPHRASSGDGDSVINFFPSEDA